MRKSRINEIHQRLRAGRPFNAQKYANERDVDERTIRRDLAHMRDEMRLPIAFDHGRRSWYYTDATVEIPDALISAEDRFALLVARPAAEQFRAHSRFHSQGNAHELRIDRIEDPLRRYRAISNRARRVECDLGLS